MGQGRAFALIKEVFEEVDIADYTGSQQRKSRFLLLRTLCLDFLWQSTHRRERALYLSSKIKNSFHSSFPWSILL